MTRPAAPRGLHALARLHGVQTAYYDNDDRRVGASPEALMGALRALGVPVRDAAAIPRLLDQGRRRRWERALEPVVVHWIEGPAAAVLRIPVRLRDRPLRVGVQLEDGGEEAWSESASSLRVVEDAEVDGVAWVALELPLRPLPAGYHALTVEVGDGPFRRRYEARIIAAPRRARGWDVLDADRPAWGVFAPLYALRSGGSGGPLPGGEVPTFLDLLRLAERVADAGGAVVGTLPLLAAFLGERPHEPSPYAPVSRLFWNELYADPLRGLEDAGVRDVERFAAYATPPIRPALFEREEGPAPLGELRFVRDGRVDPQVGMRLRRSTLDALAQRFFRHGEPPELAEFRARNPRAADYAAFRALVEARGAWRSWPARLRGRDVRKGDTDPLAVRYQLYVQWLAERQLGQVRDEAAARGVGLYLDLPLGVHPDGYDVWRERELFALDATAGAPPDALAAGGQDWGFPPMHPGASRREGHRYFRDAIRKHLQFARVLRIDHVMQLHRMYWVPGGDARDGVYVRYPAEELFAVLAVESHRAGAVIVGEDLGTVPREIRRGMKRHGLPGMYVAEFELTDTTRRVAGEDRPALEPKPVPAGALAAIGTHDTPTFAGWWWGRDIEIRRELGQVSDEEAAAELEGRGIMREKLARGLLGEETGAAAAEAGQPGAAAAADVAGADGVARRVQEALLRRMGGGPAGLVLATMEDLWLELEPQNVPGTTGEWNWRRRAARPLAALAEEPGVVALLNALNASREGNG